MCAWCIDSVIWYNVRDKILKGRYAGCKYSMLDSFSPVIIRYRGKMLSEVEMLEITKLFPEHIRVEFQQVEYKGEQVTLYGRGDLLVIDRPIDIREQPHDRSFKLPQEEKEE